MAAPATLGLRERWIGTTPSEKWAWVAFAVLSLGYLIFFAQLTALPFQDFPNHLARAVVIADLLFHKGADFSQAFEFQMILVPYILGDLVLATLIEVFGTTAAAALWTAIVLLSLPAALLVYLRVLGVSRHGQLLAMLLSLYLTTDWFFLLGFMQFRLGFALLVLALAWAERLRQRFSIASYVGFALLTGVAYMTHLTAIVFLAPALGITALVRLYFGGVTPRRLVREAALMLPVVALLAWHYGYINRIYAEDSVETYGFYWGNLYRKFWRLPLSMLRQHSTASKLLLGLFVVAAAWGLWRHLHWRNLTRPAVVEPVVLALTFGALYVLLPSQYSEASYVDVRALAPLVLFAFLALVRLRDFDPPHAMSIAVPCAVLLALANLGWLIHYSSEHNAWGEEYRDVVAKVPRGAHVLPVHTGRIETLSPRLHMGSFVVTDRAAVTPLLFSGKSGSHMRYFRYRHEMYNPPEFWYGEENRADVSWQTVACEYEYLLVDAPFDAGRIALPTRVVAENGSAALLQIEDPQGRCRGT